MDKSYDVIIVGSGSVGVPSAYYLARKGLKVLVLEKRAASGQGDNKAAIGGVRATHSDPAKILLCSRSLDVVSNWKEMHGTDIGWKEGGYAFPVYDEGLKNSLTGLFPLQHRHNLEIDWVDTESMKELIPGISDEGLLGGTYSPNDGQVSPLKLPVAIQREAEKLGVHFHFNEQVLSYEVTSGKVVGVRTDKGAYATNRIVIATGSNASDDGNMLGINIPVQPDSHEAGITAPVKPFLKPLVVDMRPGVEGKTANFYFGQNDEGQIIFCYTPRELFVGDNRESLSEFLPILAGRMISLMPRLQHLLVRRVWRGCYPMTPDGVPIVDNVAGIEGLTLAVGMCGQGFMLGLGVGQEVASLVFEGVTSLPDEVHQKLLYGRDFSKASKEALK